MKAYLCLVTWPDGTEGLLFPRPGNVPVANTEEQGLNDFGIAKKHLLEWGITRPGLDGTVVRLIEFERGKILQEFALRINLTRQGSKEKGQ